MFRIVSEKLPFALSLWSARLCSFCFRYVAICSEFKELGCVYFVSKNVVICFEFVELGCVYSVLEMLQFALSLRSLAVFILFLKCCHLL